MLGPKREKEQGRREKKRETFVLFGSMLVEKLGDERNQECLFSCTLI
jgi:hypothetical protein